MVDTFQTRTVHPAALSANGNDNKTPVTGPEWPVKVQIEVEDESEIGIWKISKSENGLFANSCSKFMTRNSFWVWQKNSHGQKCSVYTH